MRGRRGECRQGNEGVREGQERARMREGREVKTEEARRNVDDRMEINSACCEGIVGRRQRICPPTVRSVVFTGPCGIVFQSPSLTKMCMLLKIRPVKGSRGERER